MIQINGAAAPDAEGQTISAYLDGNGYQTAMIAVERNEEIVSKCDYDTIVIADGDTIEIVTFMGGG